MQTIFGARGRRRIATVSVGGTNRFREYAMDRPVHVSEIVAALDHNQGIDVTKTTLIDPTGRPQYLVETPPIADLV